MYNPREHKPVRSLLEINAPRILPRQEHTVSRKDIDPDALKVLYRLKNHGFLAYLVGGGVRDLLLGRRPKDFDIGTSAHPQQVKKLFKNCFIVGRRFRLCHVRFGRNVVEVSTFRRLAEAEEGDTLIRRDNTFGSPEEDAFRRDFTVNALFYDIATFSVIDYVGGLEDVQARVIRTIGDPGVRFREDPVRMLRAVALAARLEMTIDADTVEAIRSLRGEIVKSSPARLMDELYKILRQGAARPTFEMLHSIGLLAYMLPEADRALSRHGEELLASLARLDEYRAQGFATADELTNPVLLGTLLVPLGVPMRGASRPRRGHHAEHSEDRSVDISAEMAVLGADDPFDAAAFAAPLTLPFAKRDVQWLRLILAAQGRLRELHTSPRVRHLLAGRAYLQDALRFLEIHGGDGGRALAAEWRRVEAAPADEDAPGPDGTTVPLATGENDESRPRRRRRRKRRPRPDSAPAAGEPS